MVMRSSLIVLITLLLTKLVRAQPHGFVPWMATKGKAVVLARTVGRPSAEAGFEWHPGKEDAKSPVEWAAVELETIDCYHGDLPKRFEVVVPKTLADASDAYFADEKSRGPRNLPMEGLQIGDVAVWGIQKVQPQGYFFVSGWMAPLETDLETAKIMTAPGHDYALASLSASPPLLITGKFPGWGSKPRSIPSVNRSASGALRYAELLVRTAAMYMGEFSGGWQMRRWMERLVILPSDLDDSGHRAVNDLVDESTLRPWLKKTLLASFLNRNAGDRLNLLAIQMHWEWTANLEKQFLQLLSRADRDTLLVPLPPIQSENFHIEECESDSLVRASQGFNHMRDVPGSQPRVVRAAIRWLQILLAGDAERRIETGGGNSNKGWGIILIYVAEKANRPDLRENALSPSGQQLKEAIKVAKSLIGER
jgi:hypothetical protein